ncbi:hypothetical protein [Deinococcus koreensis]|uniref:Uncharacterized protein n=1 Tax=Deinococcus koreensis TaxID=2054903 RepID=A0A2K3UX67_9DEIO|nr:hypothetical protein [Deinococcus koreensis]PNY81127.1 hypothetical protein CVO96_06825 [Deinococcus koreensis]
MDGALGWVGAGLLLLAGAGWGAQLARGGVTWPALGLGLSTLGLGLTANAFLHGHDLPLIQGAVGALGASALLIFTRRD